MSSIPILSINDLYRTIEGHPDAAINALRYDGVTTHLVVFQNADPRSVHYRSISLVPVGPGHPAKTPAEYAGRILSHEESGAGVQGLVGAVYIEPMGFDIDDDLVGFDHQRAFYRSAWIMRHGERPQRFPN